MARAALLLLVAAIASACASWGLRKERERSGRRFAAAEALYRGRNDPDSLDGAIQGWLDLDADRPGDRRVLERLAAAFYARGYGYAGAHPDDLRVAREYGLRCLLANPAFAALVAGAGGRIEPGAVAALDSTDAPCLVRATLAWARAIEEAGPAAMSLDLDVVEAMGRRAVELDLTWEEGRAREAFGLALALRPGILGGDASAAAAELDRAAAGGRLSPRVDLAVHVFGAAGDASRWRAFLEDVVASPLDGADPDLLEDRRAVDRAREALARGEPEPSPWRAR